MTWHPQPSLGAACTTKENLSPKSTLGLSGPTLLHTGSRLCTTFGGGWERGKGAQDNAPEQDTARETKLG